MKRYLITLLALILTTGSVQAGWMAERFDSLSGSEWLVTQIEGQPGIGEAFLQFGSDGRLAGHTGVNHLSGSYEAARNELTFGPLISTRMAGPPELMEQEARLARALEKVNGSRRERVTLTLLADGQPLMTLRQRDFD